MKRLLALLVLCLPFVLLCPNTQAWRYEPHGSCQWENAQVQRLTYNGSENSLAGLYIDENDKLSLFYHQWKWDPQVQPYRDSMFVMTRQRGEEWSEPEKIGNPSFDVVGRGRCLGYDATRGIIHIVYTGARLYYTNSDVPDWEIVEIDTLPEEHNPVYRSLAMTFDTLGNVHLAWHMDFDSIGSSWYKVVYANNSTGVWVKRQLSEPIWLGYGASGETHLALQKNGAAHIVYHGENYCDLDCEGFYVRNDSLNSSNWTTDTLPKPSRPLWHYWVGPIEVDCNDRIHIVTGGCIEQDCVWPRLTRTFYYYKQTEGSTWCGPEQIPDTTFGASLQINQLITDKSGIPYLSYEFSSNEAYFTDRKQGSWQVPYMLVGWNKDAPDSFMVKDFFFVLDSQGKGHAAFTAFNFAQGSFENDSVEVYYLSSSNSSVDSPEDNIDLHHSLSQNYPNPFNSSTTITYEVEQKGRVTLKIYDLLGREVRELADGYQEPGRYRVCWNGRNNEGKQVASGIYFCRLRVAEGERITKMLLVK
jgi:hypothetical protein